MRIGRQSAQPGSTLERVGRAHRPPSERAATAAKSSSPGALPLPRTCGPARRGPLHRWARVAHQKPGELPSSTSPGMPSAAPTTAGTPGTPLHVSPPQLRDMGQGAGALLYAAPAREELITPIGLVTHRDPSHVRRAKRHEVRGVHDNVFGMLWHHAKVGSGCVYLVVVETLLRFVCPERLEEQTVFTRPQLLEEELGF